MATINDIYFAYPVSIIPFTKDGIHMTPHPELSALELSSEHSKELIAEILNKPAAVELFESSLQGLSKKSDGTPLLSAFGRPGEFADRLCPLEHPLEYIIEALRCWDDGAKKDDNDIEAMFDFGDARKRTHS